MDEIDAAAQAKARELCDLIGDHVILHGFHVRRHRLGLSSRKRLDRERNIQFDVTANRPYHEVSLHVGLYYGDSVVRRIMYAEFARMGGESREEKKFDVVIGNSIDRIVERPPPHKTSHHAQYIMQASTDVNIAFDWFERTFPDALKFFSEQVETREKLAAALADASIAKRINFMQDSLIRARVALAIVLKYNRDRVTEPLDDYEWKLFMEDDTLGELENLRRFKQAIIDEYLS